MRISQTQATNSPRIRHPIFQSSKFQRQNCSSIAYYVVGRPMRFEELVSQYNTRFKQRFAGNVHNVRSTCPYISNMFPGNALTTVFCAKRTYVLQPVDTTCEGFYSMEHSNSVPAETAKSDALPHPNVSVHDYIPLFPCADPKIAADEMTDSKYRGRCLKDLFLSQGSHRIAKNDLEAACE